MLNSLYFNSFLFCFFNKKVIENMRYPYDEIENKWRDIWSERQVFSTDLTDLEKKLYCLVMFIYPSGAKLHIGHWYNYGPTDSYARYKKLRGFNVFEPIGYDAFGLPAENYAIKTGVHPQDSTMKNIEDIRVQLKKMGCMYDWNAELMTCAPEYYKWNQWLFLQLYKKGLAYRKNAPVNWCPSCKTVLANEQVQSDGACERCGATVIHKNLTQWFFKITEYAEELISGLDTIDWPERTKAIQRNWIGKSVGTEIVFSLADSENKFTVFTTRPDTLFGVTYVVLAPEHELVEKITTEDRKAEVEEYIRQATTLSEIERTSTVKEKTGVFTGAYAVNPINGEKTPIWIADYVLASYGTGAVMAVPGHDERDFEFAAKYKMPIRKVILEKGKTAEDELTEAFTGAGTMINSGAFNGLPSGEGKEKISDYLEENNFGERKVNYRLRDWLISRQRYWGTPIPVIYCEDCGEVPVPEDQLPIELPYDVKFEHDGGSPLAGNDEFVNTVCPSCGKPAKRDVDTMDTFVDSSWYYLRYLNPHYEDGMFDAELADKWIPVDTYVGGAEHAAMHLLYSRFIHKFLRDIKLVNSDEPFRRLIHQGIITNQGAKMSKSKGNVVNPNVFTSEYGSDVFRMYMMFMGPYEQGGDWSDKGIVGVDRFVQRAYSFYKDNERIFEKVEPKEKYSIPELSDSDKSVYRKTNAALKRVEYSLEHFSFNTAVAALMELQNEFRERLADCGDEIKAYALARFTVMLAPLAPHLAEEGWRLLGGESSLFENPVWYEIDEQALSVDEVVIVVQVNGKVRAKFSMPKDSNSESVKAEAFKKENVINFTEGKDIIKEIYIPNKIFNIVVKG